MPISFDTTGLVQTDPATWQDPDTGDMVQLRFIDMVPDLPAALTDLPALRHRLTEHRAADGGLVEAHVEPVAGRPALVRIEKLPIPGAEHGLVFVATVTVPRATCSANLTIVCPERGATGVREATVGASVGLDAMYPPHPYAPEIRARLPYNVADDSRWDQQFPDHPLSRVRRLLTAVLRTAQLDPNFAALPPFPGPGN